MKLPALNMDVFRWFPLRWVGGILKQWRLITSALISGVIVHILVTLSSAQFGEAASFKLLTRGLPINQVAFGQSIRANAQPLPFFNADALYSFCHYNASATRIRVSAKLPEAGWSLSLHTPKGQNFYYVPGTDRRETNVELMLEPPGNVFAHGSTEVTQNQQNIPVVKLPHVRGLVILRAPIKGLAYRRQIDEQRAAFKCRVSGLR